MMRQLLHPALRLALLPVLSLMSLLAHAQTFNVTSPPSIAGSYEVALPDFGPIFNANFSRPLVEAVDTSGATTACFLIDANISDLNNVIALIDRGDCSFVDKALNAQAAGALAVIICNDDQTHPDSIFTMTGTDGCQLNIPTLMLSYNDCQALRMETNVAVNYLAPPVPPPGHYFETAIAINAGIYTVDSIPESGGTFPDAEGELWYEYTAPADGLLSISSCGSPAATRLFVTTHPLGCSNDLNLYDFAENNCSGQNGSQLDLIVEAGETYYIIWDDAFSSSGFQFVVNQNPLPSVPITFSVNMNAEVVSPDGVRLLIAVPGTDDLANVTAVSMADADDDGIYTADFSVTTLDTIGYAFVNGNVGLANIETVPSACGESSLLGFNLRPLVNTAIEPFELPTVCFSACGPCLSTVNTVVDGICEIPADTSIHLYNPNDPTDSLLVAPIDSTASNGLGGLVDPCLQDTLYRIWRDTFMDMTVGEQVQRIIVREDVVPPMANFTIALDSVVECANRQLVFQSWRNSRLLAVNSNVSDCSGSFSIDEDMPLSSFLPSHCDTLLVTFTLEDQCGNDTNYLARFITLDTVAPELLNLPPDTVTVGCDTIAQYLLDNPPSMVTATDNCAPNLTVAFTQDTVSTSMFCPDREIDILRQWSVTDSCGQTVSATQLIRVRDDEAPTFTRPPDISISCEDNPLDLSITGTVTDTIDNCGGPIMVTFMDQLDTLPGSCAQDYRIRRQWRAADACGTSSIINQVITVEDKKAPAFLVPADTTVNCGQEDDLMVTGQPSMLSDNCSITDSLTVEVFSETIIAGSCENDYVVERAWRVTDECGNDSIQVQRITVVDAIAPSLSTPASDLLITCTQGMDLQQAYANWIGSHGGAVATDLCTPTDSLGWSALVAGTNQPVGAMPVINCPAGSDTLLLLQVDFTVDDNCGNTNMTRAQFLVIDNTPPSFEACPSDTIISTNAGQCSANFELPVPFIKEECAAASTSIVINDSAPFTSEAQPGQEANTPVNAIELSFPVSHPLPINAQGNGQLSLQLFNADAEGLTEFFRVFGEDGTLIGRSGRSSIQCGDSDTTLVIPKPLLDLWAVDGLITIRLEPNAPPLPTPGSFAINDICSPGSSVSATLSFEAANLTGLEYAYKVNDGARIVADSIAPIPVTLPLGEHTITYYASDCAGNTDSCSYQIRVEDLEPPQLACPADLAIPLEPGACSSVVSLPLPTALTDNCALPAPFSQRMPTDTSNAWLTFAFDPNLNDYLPNDKSYSFNGVAANAVDDVMLTLDLRADLNSSSAFFNLLDEAGNFLGATTPGIASCASAGTYTISIPAEDFNEWASDGQVSFTLQAGAVPVPPGGPGDGITPCNPAIINADGDTDSLSYAFLTLTYQPVTPFYYAEGATTIPYAQMPTPALMPTHEFNTGQTTVYYITPDAVGNLDTCSYVVDIIDNEPPTALCNATFVNINPSGLSVDTVSVAEFDAGSFDNCAIDTMFLSPNTFTCDQAGTTVQATLTVIDVAGNTSTCTRPIRIEAEAPDPTFSSGICGGDTLYLFANPPEAEGGIIYSYAWRGPNGQLVSTQENPVLPNVDASDAGAYVLTIQGITGCVAEAVVNVDIINQPLTPSLTAANQQCADEPIVLNSSIVLNGATYYWYEGQPSSGNLLSTSSQPMLTLPAANVFTPTTRFFYLVIEANGCLSEPSIAKAILLTPRPQAFVESGSITVCQGSPFNLGSPVAGTGITYQWTGPNGFNSNQQYPPTIASPSLAAAGIYQLVITRNGCPSNPATTIVNILPKPARPSLTVDGNPICEGDDIVLRAEPPGAAAYTWTGPDLNPITTQGNTLALDGVTPASSGNWTAQSVQFGCQSDMSFPLNVIVNQQPNAMASSNIGPEDVLCERASLELFATPNLPGASYMWTGPNNYMSVAQNPVLNQVGPSRSGQYTLSITSAQGCSDTAAVDVEVIETIDIIGVSNNAPNCLYGGTNVTLEATVFPVDDGSYQYQWTGPGFSSSDEVAVVPNVTGSQNGFTYSLVVLTEEGCPSLPASTILQVKNAPARLPSPTSISGSYTRCEGEAITLEAAFVPNALYTWFTPSGPQNTASDPTLELTGLEVNDAGDYQVYVIVDGCASVPSPVRNVTVNPKPVVQASSNSPVCEGSALELFASSNVGGSSFNWTGPLSSSAQNPVIASADPLIHAGTYTVVANRLGCVSTPATVTVAVEETLPAPTSLDSNSPICIDAPGATLAISVPNGEVGSGISYIWYNGGAPIDTTPTPNLLITDFSPFAGGSLSISVEAQSGNCISDPSMDLLIALDTIPDELAMAGLDTAVCLGTALQLGATAPQASVGTWSVSSGGSLNIAAPNDPSTALSGFAGGASYTLLWSLSNGGCFDFSVDTLQLDIEMAELADAGLDTLLCPGQSIVLNASPPVDGQGRWSQSQVQEDFNIVIDSIGDPATSISGSGLLPGNTYAFTWTVESECGADSMEVFISIADNNPFAGFDQIVCDEDGRAQLAAGEPADGSTGRWSSPDGRLVFSNRNSTDTEVANLAVGSNLAVWTLDEGLCGSASSDTLLIDYQLPPLARDDERTIAFAVETVVDVLANDEVPPGTTVAIVLPPFNGRAQVLGDGQIAYTPDPDFVGTDELLYQICREGCACDEALLRLTVGEGVVCEPPSVITPNGDGINDNFIIPCLLDGSGFPNSRVSIFNRWGDEVYRSPVPYPNDWSGTFNGEDLPVDTYFYILDLGDGSEPIAGYLMIQR